MKIFYFFQILFLLYFCACSSTYRFQNSDFSLAELNTRIEGGSASVVLTNGREYDGHNFVIGNQKIFWIDSRSGKAYSVSPSDVQKIIDRDHGKGAIEGIGAGFASGFSLGALIGLLSFDPDAEHGWVEPDSYGSAALGAGLLLGIPIAIAGLPIGALAGHQDIFFINEQPARSREVEYVKIMVDSIAEENNDIVTVGKSGSYIRIERSQIKKIEKIGINIFITIPADVYNQSFK